MIDLIVMYRTRILKILFPLFTEKAAFHLSTFREYYLTTLHLHPNIENLYRASIAITDLTGDRIEIHR